MAFKEKSLYFQVLKWTQLTFTFVVFVLEMAELGACLNYASKADEFTPPAPNPFLISDLGSRWLKKYLYLVLMISIFSVSFYLAKLQGSWTEKNGPYVSFELSLLILWFSGSFANLYDIFNHAPSNYTSYLTQKSVFPQLPQEPLTAYTFYLSSLTFSFATSFTFMASTFIAHKVKKEKRVTKVRNVRKVKLIKFAQSNNTKDVTFVRTESHASINEKIVGFKGFVEVKIDDVADNERKGELSDKDKNEKRGSWNLDDDEVTLYNAYGDGSKDEIC